MVHESACQSPNQIWSFAKRFLQDCKEAVSPLSFLRSHKGNRWVAPTTGMVKINVDVATSENRRNSSVGVIIRDSQGLVVAACSRYLFGLFTASEEEVLAVECGIVFARELELSQVIIESNALSVVKTEEYN